LGWGAKGDTVIVHDTKALEATVLPIYFRHGNYRSFVRQLNLYEFRKDSNRKHIVYRHPEVKGGSKGSLGTAGRFTSRAMVAICLWDP
jgi:heat shock transcription factor 1